MVKTQANYSNRDNKEKKKKEEEIGNFGAGGLKIDWEQQKMQGDGKKYIQERKTTMSGEVSMQSKKAQKKLP